MAPDLGHRCQRDGEFRLAARHWNGGFRFVIGDRTLGVTVEGGTVTGKDPAPGPGIVELDGPLEVWARLLEGVPPRFATDLLAVFGSGMVRRGDELAFWQYYPALQRAVELLRSEHRIEAASEAGPQPRFDSPIGRYLRVSLGGEEHRLYVEEAGSGIPMLLQHTAGAHSVQWRHLFECAEIVDHFRLVAYDLPFHGKSIPPVGPRWWQEPYQLTADQARAVPLVIADALDLERPVFMGCSVGGLLALDLAHRHPDRFRAVVSLEGALKVDGSPDMFLGFWHPQVSGETKARMMEGLMSPTAPIEYRKETSQTYAAGWPPAFIGDLHYYFDDFDLRELASTIDTSRVGVHILSGEYDHSAPVERGRAAHQAIKGSTFTAMKGLGHFPMCEDPVRFLTYLLPVLARIREEDARA